MPEIKETTFLKDLWNEDRARELDGDQLALLALPLEFAGC